MPQIGIVKINNNVEIGCNCAIDRGSLNFTEIKKGVKIDLIIDNDPALKGVQFFNHTIHSPEIIKDFKNKENAKVVLTALKGYEKFKHQLISLGIQKKNIETKIKINKQRKEEKNKKIKEFQKKLKQNTKKKTK